MSDALSDINGNRLDAAPGHDHNNMEGKHRGSVAEDDREGRREPTGHGRHRRLAADHE